MKESKRKREIKSTSEKPQLIKKRVDIFCVVGIFAHQGENGANAAAEMLNFHNYNIIVAAEMS